MERVNIETERQDLFDVSIVIAMRLHISGDTNDEAIRSAFDKAVRSHEILGTKVQIDEAGKAYYEKPENACFDSNRIYFEETDWQSIIHREEKKRFKLEEGEFLRCFVYDHDNTTDVKGVSILLLMHHLGGDGKSLVYFIETFMNYLSGRDYDSVLEMRTIPAGDLSDKALKDRVGPLAALPKIFNKKWLKDNNTVFTFQDMDDAYEKYWENHESDIREYVISPEITSKILSRCKEWNIGFTSYITTCFLRRMGRKMDIGFAVDAREDGNKSMGNQATGISIKYVYNYNKSFRQNAVKVQKAMNTKLEDEGARNFILPFMAAFEPTLVDAINLEHAGIFNSKTSRKLAEILGYVKKTKDLSITNLTRLDIPDEYLCPVQGADMTAEKKLKIDYFSFIPPVVSYGKNIIGISTIGDSTVMTIHRIK